MGTWYDDEFLMAAEGSVQLRFREVKSAGGIKQIDLLSCPLPYLPEIIRRPHNS